MTTDTKHMHSYNGGKKAYANTQSSRESIARYNVRSMTRTRTREPYVTLSQSPRPSRASTRAPNLGRIVQFALSSGADYFFLNRFARATGL